MTSIAIAIAMQLVVCTVLILVAFLLHECTHWAFWNAVDPGSARFVMVRQMGLTVPCVEVDDQAYESASLSRRLLGTTAPIYTTLALAAIVFSWDQSLGASVSAAALAMSALPFYATVEVDGVRMRAYSDGAKVLLYAREWVRSWA